MSFCTCFSHMYPFLFWLFLDSPLFPSASTLGLLAHQNQSVPPKCSLLCDLPLGPELFIRGYTLRGNRSFLFPEANIDDSSPVRSRNLCSSPTPSWDLIWLGWQRSCARCRPHCEFKSAAALLCLEDTSFSGSSLAPRLLPPPFRHPLPIAQWSLSRRRRRCWLCIPFRAKFSAVP